MNTTIKILSGMLVSLLFSAVFFSCRKGGVGGDGSISVFVTHHMNLIPGARVYVKYGAKEFPGTDLGVYDDWRICGTSGAQKGRTSFEGLKRGYYYFYIIGYDSAFVDSVSGGLLISLKNHEQLEEELPVYE